MSDEQSKPVEAPEPPTESASGGFLKLDINPPVFLTSAALILLFVIVAMAVDDAGAFFDGIQSLVADRAGWFFVLSVNVFLIFVLIVMVSPLGRIRLGGADSRPEFSNWSWFSMLFSAGMGIGLLFWSVAEPIYHFSSPPVGEPGTLAAARQAMELTFYHWGLHAWGIYALVGLALSFFAFNKGLPFTIRSVFYPIFRERINGPIGHVIDILATVATLFGVATSLGLGVQQVNAGLTHVFGIEQSPLVQILLIMGITLLATASVVLGVNAGIRRLSEINLVAALLLLLFVLFAGPTMFILNTFVQNVGNYLNVLPQLSFWTGGYSQSKWGQGWTIFYWAWWISWSPFVGMFIARVSRGRTIREFLMGVLFVPVVFTFIWLTVFGDTALYVELYGAGGITEEVQENLPVALFKLLERFPLGMVTSLLAVAVVVTFFVTSSDSGSLVIDIITAGGELDPPVVQRIFWALMEGFVAAVLLVGGGLAALQTAAITTGLPFTIVLILMMLSLLRGLRWEYLALRVRERQAHAARVANVIMAEQKAAAAAETKTTK